MMISTWEQVTEACPRGRWKRDIDADCCEQPGCQVKFGLFGMPGLSWSPSSTVKTNSSSGMEAATPFTIEGSPFARANSLSSIDSLCLLNPPIVEETTTKGRSPAPSLLDSTTSLFAPLRLFDSFTRDMAGTSTSLPMPTTPKLLSPKSSIFSSSLESNNSRRSISPSPFPMPRSPFKVHRRHHCRRCGSCFCGQHSSNTLILTAAREDVLLLANKDLQPLDSPFTVEVNGLIQPIDTDDSNESMSTSTSGKRYIRARVCDGCFYHVQKIKSRIEEAIVSDGESAAQSGSYFSLGKGWNTPTILEDDEEYFVSRDRVQSELQREQKEVLKVLRNDVSANRIIAKAVESREATSSPTKNYRCDSPLFDYSKSLEVAKSNELILDPQLQTAATWEKVEIKRQREAIAKRAMSLDSIMMANNNNNSSIVDQGWESEFEAVLKLSQKPIFERLCPNRPPSPQPFKQSLPKVTCETGFDDIRNNPPDTILSPSQATPRLGRMGARRLQQSIDSSLKSTSRIMMRLPEGFSRPPKR